MAPTIQRCFARVAHPGLRLSAFGRTRSFLSSYPLLPTRCSPNGGRIRAIHSGWPRRLATVGTAVQYKQSDRQSLPAISVQDQRVSITWDAQTRSRFHYIWLRDHCRCSQCFHAITYQRLLNTFEIPKDIHPRKTVSRDEGLEVQWSDSHIALYPWQWLRTHSYDPPLSPSALTSEKVIWGLKMVQSPPTVKYTDVMSGNDSGVYQWLSNIDRFGFSFVSGVPVSPEATEELSTRIGFIRETQYGKFWEFTSDMTKGDTAYTSLALAAHTDNTYFTDPAGLQLFHLLSHTDGSGGETLLVDGFYVASIFKDAYPEAYELLSRVRVPAHAAGEADSLYLPSPSTGYPVLGHDSNGQLVQVRWNNDDRSVMSGLRPDEVEAWYEAIRIWNRLLTSPDSEYWVQLTPGTVIAIDNHRVLHGRSSFDGKRRMCGAYIGIDEYRSRLAVLSERFGGETLVNGRRSVWHPAL